MKKILLLSMVLGCGISLQASEFNENFNDSTLRIDYILGGNPEGSYIYLQGQTKQAGWAGRTSRLKEIPVSGNGDITVIDPVTGDTLYNNCFSTLFQEWIYTPEAKTASKSFENSFLVPLPKKDADIRLTLRNNRNEVIASHNHRYRKDDELVRDIKHAPLPHKYIHKGGEPGEAIDLAILAEGYTAEEMDSFLEAAERVSNDILSYEPFASNKDKFNIVAVMTPSEESGVSVPLKDEWKDTRYGSHYSTFYSGRYLTSPRVWRMHQDLEGLPYEWILMLVNTTEYGGGGIFNSYQIAAANNELTPVVAVHEFGHSFAGLADEYNYEDNEDQTYVDGVEPWEKNITTLADFDSKWKSKVSPDTPIPTPWTEQAREESLQLNNSMQTVGAYEGAGYRKTGVYRPVETCRMRDNYYPEFCVVCEEAIREIIDFYTN
ncbi:MAG: peptidase M64 [Muribaculaceae bacterium]|nr:peptidase M64 [Muribaculaceae bacterium]